jgi:hypothetical protein
VNSRQAGGSGVTSPDPKALLTAFFGAALNATLRQSLSAARSRFSLWSSFSSLEFPPSLGVMTGGVVEETVAAT